MIPGFQIGTASAGLRASGEPDVAVLYADHPCAAAGVFTTNRVKAAPVLLTQERMLHPIRALVCNSCNANACTGPQGRRDARTTAARAAGLLGVPEESVLVASTGVIGVPLPMDRILKGLDEACGLGGTWEQAARAIMTTDTFPKSATGRVGDFTLTGIAKGSGMIHPNMATMLGFLAINAIIPRPELQAALKKAVDGSFNQVTVDGDTSTNDMVLLLAGGREVLPASLTEAFHETLREICARLARDIARDGEGATRLVEVLVEGAGSPGEARQAARAVAGSSLVKAAIYGADPNWGRILASLGGSGAEFRPEDVEIRIGTVVVCREGVPVDFDEEEARKQMRRPEVRLFAHLGAGQACSTAWGCDLTERYVEINGSYRT
jgi:glutamate N-acetyltransferase/amino-acid N-acetyltransferase